MMTIICLFAVQCWFAFQCAVTVGATVLALEKWPISASLRPLDIYIYAFGSQSCATRLVFEGSARQDPDRDRAWHLWSSSSRSAAPRPRSRSPRRLSRRLHGCFVGGIPPSRLATCTTAHPPNRAVSCRSARHSARRSASSLHVKPLQANPTGIARPSVRRVCFRSLCARRLIVGSLNFL